MDRARVTRLRNHPERHPVLVLWALRRGVPLGRRMTPMERVSLAVASARPTHHVTLGTRDMAQPELAEAFDRLKSRIGHSRRSRSFRLLYFGVFAQGNGNGGCHLHLLLWQWPYIPVWLGHARGVGMGHPHFESIEPSTPENVLRVVGYVLGQNESVFGTDKHQDNAPHPKHMRGFVKNEAATLTKHKPELLRAMELAKTKSLSDRRLYAELPKFIRT